MQGRNQRGFSDKRDPLCGTKKASDSGVKPHPGENPVNNPVLKAEASKYVE